MSQRLTKRLALLECSKLWLWLSRNPKKQKSAWPGWDAFKLLYAIDDVAVGSYCPCCLYDDIHGGGCYQCPLGGTKAWSKDYVACTDSSSPFDRWVDSEKPYDMRTRVDAALELARISFSAYRREARK